MTETAVALHRDCRGWPLVRGSARLSPAERGAADGHLALCRHCRTRLDAEYALRQRIAAAGSATLGTGIAAAVARSLGGGGGILPLGAPASALPVAAAIAAATVVTAGAGGVVATMRGIQPAPARTHVGTSLPATSRAVPAAPAAATPSRSSGSAAVRGGSGSSPAAATSSPAPGLTLPGLTLAPAKTTAPVLPLPTDTTLTSIPPLPGLPAPSLSPLPVRPLPSASVTVPGVTLPALPVPSVSTSPLSPLPVTTTLAPILR